MVIDAGAGDGGWVLRGARAEPSRFFIALDSNAENLEAASSRAARKPQRGGAPNALFVHAAAEALPAELDGVASALRVILPWGSLLATVALPDMGVLAGLARICRAGARLHVVFGYDASVEAEAARLPALTDEQLLTLPASYAGAGFGVAVRSISHRDLAGLGTTWSGRLAHGRARRFCEVRGTRG